MPVQLVEVARGRLKPLARCTPAERRRAQRHLADKQALVTRWLELVQRLGEDWIPQTPLVMAIGSGEVPTNTTVPEWEKEIESLEFVAAFKESATGSVN